MKLLRRAERKGKKFVNPVPTKVGDLRTMLRLIPLFLSNKAETFPRQPLGPFKTDAKVYAHVPATGLRVTWLGHSSMVVEIDGVRLLIDPVWEQRASPVQWAGPRRFFAPPLRLEDIPGIDAVLISHDHYDHLGVETVRRLVRLESMARAKWVTSLGVGRILERCGVPSARIKELDWTESVTIVGGESGRECLITSWPARHFSGRSAFNGFETLWASLVLKGDVHTVYYGADTGWWDGFDELASKYGGFDLTMLEVGAFHELWRDIHLGPDGAVQAFRSMGSKGLLMPIHWGLFDLALHGWREPMIRVLELAAEHHVKLWAPEPGCPTDVVSETPLISEWWR
jgi:L-ascorbate metabolism protein UlaG (beta-lactamase superfamily)